MTGYFMLEYGQKSKISFLFREMSQSRGWCCIQKKRKTGMALMAMPVKILILNA